MFIKPCFITVLLRITTTKQQVYSVQCARCTSLGNVFCLIVRAYGLYRKHNCTSPPIPCSWASEPRRCLWKRVASAGVSEWSSCWNKRQSFFRGASQPDTGSWISHPDHNRWSKQIREDEPRPQTENCKETRMFVSTLLIPGIRKLLALIFYFWKDGTEATRHCGRKKIELIRVVCLISEKASNAPQQQIWIFHPVLGKLLKHSSVRLALGWITLDSIFNYISKILATQYPRNASSFHCGCSLTRAATLMHAVSGMNQNSSDLSFCWEEVRGRGELWNRH